MGEKRSGTVNRADNEADFVQSAARTRLDALRLTVGVCRLKLSKAVAGLAHRGVLVVALVAAVVGTLAGARGAVTPATRPPADRDQLWKIVHDRCERDYHRTGAYAPCTLVDESSGIALYKADGDPYQFLLLPLARVSGIEDRALQEPSTGKYLYEAWADRFAVTARLYNALPESHLVLTINAKSARSQDQLHIHISCSSPATLATLKEVNAADYVHWKQLPVDLGGHSYHVLAVNTDTLKSKNLFRDIHDKVAADGKKMENASVALANVAPDRFLLLVVEGTDEDPVAAEALQDHDCSVAKPLR
ncbi:putative CDP-diacylglycerol pyrophosphatase [Mycobacterium marinum]|nr:putative CDP-diacylglycerol pyrophosphatase [Mycobacterium marinum]GJP04792.1 putative CDP-diacylglycerol pyrophosphatase [Mycobacterium marinum]GJP18852.1 putative CDP-diacylglycerol pyrophosphatase [Mycobacterium marinum]